MSNLYIICEGQSEQQFVNGALASYLYAKGCQMAVKSPILKSPKAKDQSHKGGMVTFDRLRTYIGMFLKQEPSKRIANFFEEVKLKYKKPTYAALYAQKCDIDLLCKKCQHFNDWIAGILKCA